MSHFYITAHVQKIHSLENCYATSHLFNLFPALRNRILSWVCDKVLTTHNTMLSLCYGVQLPCKTETSKCVFKMLILKNKAEMFFEGFCVNTTFNFGGGGVSIFRFLALQ